MLSVLMPSRGLMHSRTMEHVEKNLKEAKIDSEILFTHELPIPDCFNCLIDMSSNDMIWIVEDDMGFPDYTLKTMLEYLQEADESCVGVTINYPVGEGTNVCQYRENKLDYGGTGCLLLKKHELDEVLPLRSDILFDANTGEILPYHSGGNPYAHYGLHDIYLYKMLKNFGKSIHVLDNIAGWQYRVENMGDPTVNKGFHDIVKLKFK